MLSEAEIKAKIKNLERQEWEAAGRRHALEELLAENIIEQTPMVQGMPWKQEEESIEKQAEKDLSKYFKKELEVVEKKKKGPKKKKSNDGLLVDVVKDEVKKIKDKKRECEDCGCDISKRPNRCVRCVLCQAEHQKNYGAKAKAPEERKAKRATKEERFKSADELTDDDAHGLLELMHRSDADWETAEDENEEE